MKIIVVLVTECILFVDSHIIDIRPNFIYLFMPISLQGLFIVVFLWHCKFIQLSLNHEIDNCKVLINNTLESSEQ